MINSRLPIGIIIVICFFVNTVEGLRTGTFKEPDKSNKSVDLRMIDSQIESLEILKEHYLSKASRMRNLGDRIKYDSDEDSMIIARGYWKTADSYDAVSDSIQDEINELEKEKTYVRKKREY